MIPVFLKALFKIRRTILFNAIGLKDCLMALFRLFPVYHDFETLLVS